MTCVLTVSLDCSELPPGYVLCLLRISFLPDFLSRQGLLQEAWQISTLPFITLYSNHLSSLPYRSALQSETVSATCVLPVPSRVHELNHTGSSVESHFSNQPVKQCQVFFSAVINP